jgi:hypothetical protein
MRANVPDSDNPAANPQEPYTSPSLGLGTTASDPSLSCEGLCPRVPRSGWDAIEVLDLTYCVHYARASRWAVSVEVASVASTELEDRGSR